MAILEDLQVHNNYNISGNANVRSHGGCTALVMIKVHTRMRLRMRVCRRL